MEPIQPVSLNPQAAAAKKKKNWPWIAIPIIVIVGVAAGFVAATLLKQSDSQEPAAVVIKSAGTSPGTIKIKKDQEVVWTNQDTKQHSLTADQADMADFTTDDPLQPGDEYHFTFEKTGTFTYHDANDPVFKGVVVVE